jgi:hypothetical protein
MTSRHVVVFEGLDAWPKAIRTRPGRGVGPEGPADYGPRIFTDFPVATYGVALNPNSSSARKPVTFWSNLEPASDDTSIRNSGPM